MSLDQPYPADAPEDESDLGIRKARQHVSEALELLIMVMHDKEATNDDRVRAATTILEVAGCL